MESVVFAVAVAFESVDAAVAATVLLVVPVTAALVPEVKVVSSTASALVLVATEVAAESTDVADALSVAVSVPVMVALVPVVTDVICAPLVSSRIA